MERPKSAVATVAVLVAMLALSWAPRMASGQVTTACTMSMISSFTPCMNYLTGSSNGGSSPTADCCGALAGLLSGSSDCACMILTGNVPFGLPVNRSLAVALPKACNSQSVPLFKCQGTASLLPPPGGPTGGLGFPTLPPFPTSPSVLPPPTPSLPPAPADAPAAVGQPGANGIRPLVIPSSAVLASSAGAVISLLVLLAIAAALP